MEVTLRGKVLWKYVTPNLQNWSKKAPEASQDIDTANSSQEPLNTLWRGASWLLTCIMTSTSQSCKAVIRRSKPPNEVWKTLETIFNEISTAAVSARLAMFEIIKLPKGETIVECSNLVLEMVSTLECPGHNVSKVETKRALLKGPRGELHVTN